MAFIYDLLDQWNAAGTTFTGIKLNVTDSASAAGSLLMDLQVGGVSRFRAVKDGSIELRTAGGVRTLFSSPSVGGGEARVGVSGSFTLSAGNADAGSSPDIFLNRDAANTLAQRNGGNPQAFNLYNTYTDASNYERGFMRWSSNVLRIGTEKLGSGFLARALEFHTDGVARLTISADGSAIALGAFSVSSGSPSAAFGRLAIASGAYSFVAGHGVSSNTGPEATGQYSVTISNSYASRKSTASGTVASVFGGSNAIADKFGQDAYGFHGFAAQGDAQTSTLGFVGATTDDVATEIFLFNVANQRAIVPASKTWAFVLTAVARSSNGTDNAMYVRRGIIKRDGANNTTLVGAVDSVYTNETNAAWDIDVSADDTNESLKVTVTGTAATNIRWVAKVELTEVLFA